MTAKANTIIESDSLPFSYRVKLVQAEIAKRVATVNQNRQAALTARLWCTWLRREVLL